MRILTLLIDAWCQNNSYHIKKALWMSCPTVLTKFSIKLVQKATFKYPLLKSKKELETLARR